MLIFKRKSGASLIDIADVKKKQGGTLQNVNEVKALEDGKWVIVWERIPSSLNITNFHFTRSSGNGTIESLSSDEMVLRISDSDYSGALPNADTVSAVSITFKNYGVNTCTFEYDMTGDFHSPTLRVTTAGVGVSFDYSFMYKTASFVMSSEGVETTMTMRYYMADTSGQTVSSHISYCYLRNFKINGRAVAFN